MGKSTVAGSDFLELLLQAVDWAQIADNAAAPTGNISVALHTGGGPGEGGDQTTNEATYGSYARINVARTVGGWDVTSSVGSPVADIEFPTSTDATSETITYWSIGTGTADYMIAFGTVTPNIPMASSVQPKLTTASTITES